MAKLKLSKNQRAVLETIGRGGVEKVMGIREPDRFHDTATSRWETVPAVTVHSLVTRKLVAYTPHPKFWYAKNVRLTDMGRSALEEE